MLQVTEQMVEQALKSMKVGKAPGPSAVTSNLIKAAGATGVKGFLQVSEFTEQEWKFPEYWAKSYIPYRYIKVDKDREVRLLEKDMKVYEKTIEKRLRDIAKIDEIPAR